MEIRDSGIRISVNLEETVRERLEDAQHYLDGRIAADIMPFIPLRNGTLRQMIQAENSVLNGSGKVCISTTPYGRFQMGGKVMVDPVTGSPWARKGVKKVLTNRDLTYAEPMARAHWYDEAKRLNESSWLQGTEEVLNGRKYK